MPQIIKKYYLLTLQLLAHSLALEIISLMNFRKGQLTI